MLKGIQLYGRVLATALGEEMRLGIRSLDWDPDWDWDGKYPP
jgi:hypothetical protein